MKDNSTNFRNAAIQGIISRIKNENIQVIVHEPLIRDDSFLGCEVINNIDIFKSQSSIILANRDHEDLNDVSDKIFTRDLFNKDS